MYANLPNATHLLFCISIPKPADVASGETLFSNFSVR